MTFRDGMIRRTAVPAVFLALLLVPTPSGGSASQRDSVRDQDDRFSSGPLEGMRFSRIPPGRFVMGSPAEEKGRNDAGGVEEGPEHPVTLSGFEIMTTEVTQGMWLEVMGATVVEQRDRANPEWDLHGVGPAYPIYYVSKFQAEAFAEELNRRDPGRGYRLPTEAEWEYACRAGTTTRFFWGEDPDNAKMRDYGWIDLTDEGTSYPVGQKAPNAWGLHDMLGNVFEWVGDWRAPYSAEAQTDPTGPATGTMGIIRGGDWYHNDLTGRCAARANSLPQNARYTSGFRLVRDSGGVQGRGGETPDPRRSPPRFVDSGQALGDSRVFRVAPGDFDGDGDADVLVVDFQGPTHLWTNDGRGRFTDTGQTLGETGGHGAAVGDLDGDSDLDVYLVHNGHPDRVFLNDGHGVLIDSGQRLGGQEEWGTTAVLGDVDGDGDLDAYVTVFQGPGHLWINDGSGRFTDSGRSLDGTPTSVAFGDIDGDGDLDAVVAYPRSEDRVWFNDGTGRLRDSGQRLGPEVGWGFVELGDVDADGDVDALVTNSEMGNRVWFNDGRGTFSLSAEYFGTGSRAALGDLDGDGALDVMAISEGAARRSCTVWLNGGRGDFTGSGTLLDITGVLSLALADVDDDGDLDAVLGRMEERGGTRVFLNDPPRPARGVRSKQVRQ